MCMEDSCIFHTIEIQFQNTIFFGKQKSTGGQCTGGDFNEEISRQSLCTMQSSPGFYYFTLSCLPARSTLTLK